MEQLQPEDLINAGRLYEIGSLMLSTGGAVSNTGLALHRLGMRTALLSTVGDDAIGRLIIDHLRGYDEHLADHLLVRHGTPSSYTIVLSPAKRDRSFLHCAGTNAVFGADDVDFERAARAKVFHLGYPPVMPRLTASHGEQLTTIMRELHQRGVMTSMDMTLPDPHSASGQLDWRSVLENVLPFTSIFIPSIEEILFMLRRSDFDRWGYDWASYIDMDYLEVLADELLAMGVLIAGLKLGQYGFYVRTSSHLSMSNDRVLPIDQHLWSGVTIYQPAYAIDVISTTGAGDSSLAGFIASLLWNLQPGEACKMAAAVGAIRIASAHAHAGIPSFDEVLNRVRSNWITRRERIRGG
jgi:sugar/nucleoside kinase (ribokinase family)